MGKVQIINKDELLLGNWTPVRNEVWLSSVLSQGAKLCYIAICSHVWKSDEQSAWPGQQRLASMLNVTDRMVRNYLDELKAVNLIKVERRGLNRTNVYYLCKPDIKALKPKASKDRKSPSAQNRTSVSTQDRTPTSDKEQAVKEQKVKNKQTLIVPEKSQEQHDKKINFPSIRKRLKGEQLQVFDLIADNIEGKQGLNVDTITGKTLLELVQQSPAAAMGAYEECKQRDKKHFSYFTKVFFTHLQKGVKDGGTATVDYDNIDEGLYK